MPKVEDYAPLAPFTLDELVSAANSVLRDRPHMEVQPRTVRYYISEGLLPPPTGGPKFARYSLEHLARIVEIRTSLDSGKSLGELREGSGEPVAKALRDPAMTIAQARAPFAGRKRPSEPSPVVARTVRRYLLNERATLEVEEPLTSAEIEAAVTVLERLRADL